MKPVLWPAEPERHTASTASYRLGTESQVRQTSSLENKQTVSRRCGRLQSKAPRGVKSSAGERAVLQFEDAVGGFAEPAVMGDHDDGLALFLQSM